MFGSPIRRGLTRWKEMNEMTKRSDNVPLHFLGVRQENRHLRTEGFDSLHSLRCDRQSHDATPGRVYRFNLCCLAD